jgi:hypothetical protein
LDAGVVNQGISAVAIGDEAAPANQPAHSVVINATGAALNALNADSVVIAPVRAGATSNVLTVDTVTSEVLSVTGMTRAVVIPEAGVTYTLVYDNGLLSSSTTTYFEVSVKTDNVSTGSTGVTQFALPLESTGTYNMVVFWGDGSSSVITTWNDSAVTHTYGVAGTYTVRVYGTLHGFRFNNTGDRLKLLTVNKFGDLFRFGNSGSYFYGCANMTFDAAVDTPSLAGTTNLGSALLVSG